jgi:hypothetical protein
LVPLRRIEPVKLNYPLALDEAITGPSGYYSAGRSPFFNDSDEVVFKPLDLGRGQGLI